MPTIITHAAVAGVAGNIFATTKMPRRFWIITAICSIIPDADVIGFYLGIPYGSFFGHRGFFHSILFAFFLSIFFGGLFFREYRIFSGQWIKLVAFFFLVCSSHGILDAFTNGGKGITLSLV